MKHRSTLIVSTLLALAFSLVACRPPALVSPLRLDAAPSGASPAANSTTAEAPTIAHKRAICAMNEAMNLSTDGSWSGVGAVEEPASGSPHPEAKYIWSSTDPQPGQSATFAKTFLVADGSLLLEQGVVLDVKSGFFRLYVNDQLVVDTITSPLGSDSVLVPGASFLPGSNSLRVDAIIPTDVAARGVQALSPRKGSRQICGYQFVHGRWVYFSTSTNFWIPYTTYVPPKVKLTATFERSTLRPLKDHEGKHLGDADVKKALDIFADRCMLTIGRTLNNLPHAGTVHLSASVISKSGGHDHDGLDSGRPTGAFSLTKDGPWQTDMDVAVDSSGQQQIWYRCSGFGGEDLITVSANQATTLTVSEPVTFNLLKFGEDGQDSDLIHFVGRTDDHGQNHYCTEKSRDKLSKLAKAYADWFSDPRHLSVWNDWTPAHPRDHVYTTKLVMNDQSLSCGGPFDLGPLYAGLPSFWVVKRAHENHREGDSTDTPRRPDTIRGLYENFFTVLPESNHWHLTTK